MLLIVSCILQLNPQCVPFVCSQLVNTVKFVVGSRKHPYLVESESFKRVAPSCCPKSRPEQYNLVHVLPTSTREYPPIPLITKSGGVKEELEWWWTKENLVIF